MSEPRLNVLELIVGQKGTGKSNYTLEVNKNDKRVLYVMTTDHPKFRKYRNVFSPKFWKDGRCLSNKLWKSGHIRIVCNSSERKQVFAAINKYVTHAKICFEDATKYIGWSCPEEILDAVIDSKQRNNDIQLQFHSLRRVPMDLYDNVDYLTLFKTKDQINSIAKISEEIKQAAIKVKAHPFQYHHVTIELN